MDKAKKDFVINGLRRLSYKWSGRDEALKAAKVRHGIYICAVCKQETRRKDIEMDHIIPVKDVRSYDESLDQLADKLFVEKNGWQPLCLGCHKIKTGIENYCRDTVNAAVKRMKKELDEFYKGEKR